MMPSSTLDNKSPFELLFHDIPDIQHLRVFGCSCYPLLRPYNSTKLQPRTTKCVFLGYASKFKGYISFEVAKKRVYISRHVIFYEFEFPYSNLVSFDQPVISPVLTSHGSHTVLVPNNDNVMVVPSVSSPSLMQSSSSQFAPNNSLDIRSHLIITNSLSNGSSLSMPSATSSSHTLTGDLNEVAPITSTADQSLSSSVSVVPEFQPDQLQVVISVPSFNLHPMQTRSKSGISKKIAFMSVIHEHGGADLTKVEPATYKFALTSFVWCEAMKEELSALHNQDTWFLVPLHPHKNLVGCKWVFKIKKNADGSIGRYKARLVAKGFNQEECIDYGETFSPVVKPTTVRLVIALAAHYGWCLRQLDVKNAFLHGILQEEVYMSQPPGFHDSKHEDYVCKLHKSLYGLKQAPRAWNDRFTTFLPSLGFQFTYSDSSLFVKHAGDYIVILLLYVDDIIITGSASQCVTDVIHALAHEFDIKDLGPLHYFLGIQIVQQPKGIFLSQDKYVTDLLTKSDMLSSKPCATPYLPYNRLLKDDGKPYNNPALYRSLVGALQYLTFTRPDIAFAVHQVSQFMQAPMESHFLAVRRVLRYLRATQGCGLRYVHGGLDLTAFSDPDWAGDPNDRQSTTGLVVFLGSNPIS
ncbi:hypothetical protein ACFX1T_023520 [Malus domestica]